MNLRKFGNELSMLGTRNAECTRDMVKLSFTKIQGQGWEDNHSEKNEFIFKDE